MVFDLKNRPHRLQSVTYFEHSYSGWFLTWSIISCTFDIKDADGGIWAVSLHADGGQPDRLLTCHAGSVADMAASPLGYFLATLGSNGCLLVHDVFKKELVMSHRFKAPGNSLVWIPRHVSRTRALLYS